MEKASTDPFAEVATLYKTFRPSYPKALYDFFRATHQGGWDNCLDVGCGTGVATMALLDLFSHVTGLDSSEAQLKQMQQSRPPQRLVTRVGNAEDTHLPSNTFDAVFAAQTVHWYDMHAFVREAKRLLVARGSLCCVGYGLVEFDGDEELTEAMRHWYYHHVRPFFPLSSSTGLSIRHGLDTQYAQDVFCQVRQHFPQVVYRDTRDLSIVVEDMPVNHFVGYLNSMSAVPAYTKHHGTSPIPLFTKHLAQRSVLKRVRWPLYVVIGML